MEKVPGGDLQAEVSDTAPPPHGGDVKLLPVISGVLAPPQGPSLPVPLILLGRSLSRGSSDPDLDPFNPLPGYLRP